MTMKLADCLLPSMAVAVMTVWPSALPVTTPYWFTVATFALLEVQVTDFSVALAGQIS